MILTLRRLYDAFSWYPDQFVVREKRKKEKVFCNICATENFVEQHKNFEVEDFLIDMEDGNVILKVTLGDEL